MMIPTYRLNILTGADAGQFVSSVLATVDIPDPGYSYQLLFTGQIHIDPGDGVGIDVSIRDGKTTGGAILSTVTTIDGALVGNQGGKLPFLISGTSPQLSGPRTIALTITKWKGGSGDGWTFANASFTNATALLIAA